MTASINTMEQEDDWKPDFTPNTILKKVVVKFSDKTISNNITKYNSRPDSFKEESQQEQSDHEDNNLMFDLSQMKKDPKPTETLYDPLKDDKCQEWTRKHLYKDDGFRKPLSCAGCFTPVCYTYESHKEHEGQYYTRQLLNSGINYEKMIDSNDPSKLVQTFKPENLENLANQELTQIGKQLEAQQNNYNVYFAVECTTCQNQVALYDVDRKLYHVFSVF